MEDLGKLKLSEIYELLIVYTTQYTRLHSLGIEDSEEYMHTKEMIETLKAEIHKRD